LEQSVTLPSDDCFVPSRAWHLNFAIANYLQQDYISGEGHLS
jgi:hypothetical protein